MRDYDFCQLENKVRVLERLVLMLLSGSPPMMPGHPMSEQAFEKAERELRERHPNKVPQTADE